MIPLIFATTPRGRWYYFPHDRDQETRAQWAEQTCQRISDAPRVQSLAFCLQNLGSHCGCLSRTLPLPERSRPADRCILSRGTSWASRVITCGRLRSVWEPVRSSSSSLSRYMKPGLLSSVHWACWWANGTSPQCWRSTGDRGYVKIKQVFHVLWSVVTSGHTRQTMGLGLL